MSYLVQYYNKRAADVDRSDYLKQVGHTERGLSISKSQFENMLAQICTLLSLHPEDNLLDLCCGNGFITKRLATKVDSVIGADFSTGLIGVAKQDHHAENIRYLVMNALELERLEDMHTAKFSKVLMQGALQHFQVPDLQPLLEKIFRQSVENPVVLLGFVPDKDKRESFYDTPKRKVTSLVRRAVGCDVLGTWWEKGQIVDICDRIGRRCVFHDVVSDLDASRYRFNVTIS